MKLPILNFAQYLVLVFAMVFCMSAQAEEQTWTINQKEADIRKFVDQIAAITGKSFIVDPRIKGKVSIISQEPLDKDGVFELFQAVLHVHGYAAVPAGDVVKVIPNTQAKTDTIPFDATSRRRGEELVTRVIPVKNSPATELVPILRPMVPQYGHLAGVSSANVIIISDHAENIRRLEHIIERIDGAESEELELIELKDAWVGDIVEMLENLTPIETGKAGKGGMEGGRVRVVADERTNRIIVKGDKAARTRILELIKKLDTPASQTGGVQVIKLRHADAADMAELLKGMVDAAPAAGGKENPQSSVSILADESLNALVVRAEAATMREIRGVIAKLDVRRAQVLIEAAIVEVTGDVGKNLSVIMAGLDGENETPVGGVSFSASGNSLNDIAAAIVSGTGSIADGITLGAGQESDPDSNGDTKVKFAGLLQALATSSDTNLLSTPSIMTLDNQEASIVVGDNVPFVTGSTSGDNNSNPFTTIQRQDVGITLKVTPSINDDDTLRLEVDQESSSVNNAATAAADIITSKRQIQTTILANDQETIVLGGLIRDEVRETISKVPVLGDIPVIKYLFSARNNRVVKSNLLVFLKPTILRDGNSAAGLGNSRFLGVRSLQLALDKEGGIYKLRKESYPDDISDIFSGMPVDSILRKKDRRKVEAAREEISAENAARQAEAKAVNSEEEMVEMEEPDYSGTEEIEE